jgi:hypothetical protein
MRRHGPVGLRLSFGLLGCSLSRSGSSTSWASTTGRPSTPSPTASYCCRARLGGRGGTPSCPAPAHVGLCLAHWLYRLHRWVRGAGTGRCLFDGVLSDRYAADVDGMAFRLGLVVFVASWRGGFETTSDRRPTPDVVRAPTGGGSFSRPKWVCVPCAESCRPARVAPSIAATGHARGGRTSGRRPNASGPHH